MLKRLNIQMVSTDEELPESGAADSGFMRNMAKNQLEQEKYELLAVTSEPMSAADRVRIARSPERPNIKDYIHALFTDFIEFHGDRLYGDDKSILGGLGLFHNLPVTIMGHYKGKTLEENMQRNFGMPNPEGYRKARRLAEQAEKFRRPVIAFIDTPGAFPGLEAEARGQGEAIAQCLKAFSGLTVPVVGIVIGEGNSGGALAISIANSLIMLENAIYSVLSPEGFASILWKDSSKCNEACEVMKLTANDLYRFGIADYVIKEPKGGAQKNPVEVYSALDKLLLSELQKLRRMNGQALAENRYRKFRSIGEVAYL